MFSNPQANVFEMKLPLSANVADFGAGTGAYSLAAAKIVGGRGRVYAIDVNRDILTRLAKDAHAAHLSNIEVVAGNAEKLGGTHLRDASVEAVIMANVLFQATDKQGMLMEAKRILKPGGSIYVVDWKDSYGGIGPQPADVLSDFAARRMLERAGWVYDRSFGAGDHHYGLVYKKAA